MGIARGRTRRRPLLGDFAKIVYKYAEGEVGGQEGHTGPVLGKPPRVCVMLEGQQVQGRARGRGERRT